MSNNYFQKQTNRIGKIYAYYDYRNNKEMKVGYTTRDNPEDRIKEQFPVNAPVKKPFTMFFAKNAIRNDGTTFTDIEIHNALSRLGVQRKNGEWFDYNLEILNKAFFEVKHNKLNFEVNRTKDFALREEQKEAIRVTKNYFLKNANEKYCKFLWNAKMRFGKTFTAYKFIQEMGYKNVLIVSFKPTVKTAWKEDLQSHIDFENYIFINNLDKDETFKTLQKNSGKNIVCFSSFQDLLGKNKYGGIKIKNQWIHNNKWDLIIIDEYHFGAWRERSKDLFNEKDGDFYNSIEIMDALGIEQFPIKSKRYLYLSGTPFRAISNGEFLEDQIFNWTYTDEQSKKEQYKNDENNPYRCMPKMIMLTYKLPDNLREVALKGEFDEFSLNEFFSAKFNEENKKYEFAHGDQVKQFLNFLTGKHTIYINERLKVRDKQAPMPFLDEILLNNLSHTFWLLPNVASCYAMYDLLRETIEFKKYKIILAAGAKSKSGESLIEEIHKNMENPIETKTITLSCQKLTTGVTIRPWSGIFMLRSLKSPETYFQAAFRVQNSWTFKDDYNEVSKEENYKKECYIFDFDPNRALKQVVEYSQNLNTSNKVSTESKVKDFIKFLPILAYSSDTNIMEEVDAVKILDYTITNITYNMLVRKWESAMLVNVDNDTLKRIVSNKQALDILSKLEDFRNLNKDISIIISKSEQIKKLKTKSTESELTKEEKKLLSNDKKDEQSKRREVQKKLIKFATRIPIFMYLTDYREETLKDVITELEPDFFEKVTGLTIKDFDFLVSLNIFNEKIMNDAIWSFRRYEDSSLKYAGILKNKSEKIGLFNTKIVYYEDN